MSRQARKSFFRRVLELRLFLVVNVVILFFLVLAFGKEFARNFTIQREIDALQAQADALALRNSEVAQLVQAIQTESFIEREARLKLGLSKPGEQVVVVGEESGAEEAEGSTEAQDEVRALLTAPSQGGTGEADIANPTKWWYYFFDKPKFEAIKRYGTTAD